jgi:hypothetical protein
MDSHRRASPLFALSRAPSKGGLRLWPELRHRRVGIALFGSVELGDFRQMNFGDTNFLIAVLRLLLFLRNEFAVAELAFHRHVRTLLQGRSESGKIPPRYKPVPLRAPDVAVAVLVLPRRRRRRSDQAQHSDRRGVCDVPAN